MFRPLTAFMASGAMTAALFCLPLTTPASAADAAAKPSTAARQQSDDARAQSGPMLMSSEKMVGASIKNVDNSEETVATLSDMVMTKEGKSVYALATVGATLGVGGKTVAIPVEALSCQCKVEDGEKQCHVTINKTAEELKSAPEVSLTGYEDLTVPAFVDRNNEFFAADASESFESREEMLCCGKLTDAAVYCSSEQECGTLEALIVDGAENQAKYAIIGDGSPLGIGEKYSAVPFEALSFKMDAEGNVKVMIDAEKKVIGAAPKVTPSDYPELDREDFRENVANSLTHSGR